MAQNLNYKTENSYCWNNNEDMCLVYGRYYPFSVAMDSINQGGCGNGEGCNRKEVHQGICPEGWHLPDSSEYAKFYDYISQNCSRNNEKIVKDIAIAVRAKTSWTKTLGTNEFGLSFLGNGRALFIITNHKYSSSDGKGTETYFWANAWEKDTIAVASGDTIVYKGGFVQIMNNAVSRELEIYAFFIDNNAYNVRCIEDD